MASDTISIQEAAAQFANSVLKQINSAAAQMAGVEVFWFRATPNRRNQDVIFQAYTLYDVEPCPLQFKAVYSDAGYDEGSLTYNIMGLNFAVPMTLDIALGTWEAVTGNDGTIPQEHDIVFIPATRKLLEVASMTPVRQIGGQLTSYKVNLTIYKPTRSRIVGEELKNSIAESTTNLDERFGKDIDDNIKDIVDDDQISIYTSTDVDTKKTLTGTQSDESLFVDVRTTKMYELNVDGHLVARSYYDMNCKKDVVVRYKSGDTINKDDRRALSFWFRTQSFDTSGAIKNIKGDIAISVEGDKTYINTSVGSKFPVGSNIVIKRGKISIPGTIVSKGKIEVNGELITRLNKMSKTWYQMPGFAMMLDNKINILSGEDSSNNMFSVDIKGGDMVSLYMGGREKLIQMSNPFSELTWYGIILNYVGDITLDVFSSSPKLEKIEHIEIGDEFSDEVKINNYYVKSSVADITNIRLYDTELLDIDKQLLDITSYNVKNDSRCIINDSADLYLNKEYYGRQR